VIAPRALEPATMIRSSLCALAIAGLIAGASGQPARAQDAAPPPAPVQAAPDQSQPDQPPAPDPTQQAPTQQQTPPEPAPTESAAPAPAPSETASPSDSASTPPPAAAPTPVQVQVQSLDQLDLFSTGRDAGLGADVWKGSSADIARAVIPALAARPLSPAGMDLARRLLAQASTAPVGAGGDLDLAVARARALLAMGDAEDASLVLDRTPGVADHAELSLLAVEAALIAEQDDKACRIADNLTDGRGAPYWLRLRAFCQARAGKVDQAQLTFNLAGVPAKGLAATRLLSVYIAGAGDPGPASLHDGLDFALSRALKLDLSPALASAAPAISRHWLLKNPPAPAPAPALPAGSAAAVIQEAVDAATADRPDASLLEQLVDHAGKEPGPKARGGLEAAAAILASLGVSATGASRAQLDGFDLGRAETPPARLLALDTAAGAGLKGETALLALQVAQTGGAAGPGPADRCFVIRALLRAGLNADAKAFAVEGLLALRGPG
jgi:hypothetical protein